MFNIYTSAGGGGASSAQCGDSHRLIQRPDDKEDVISKRLEVYEAQTKPLIAYYENAGLLRPVDADADVDTVFKNIESAVRSGAAGNNAASRVSR